MIYAHPHPFMSTMCECPLWVGDCSNTSVHPLGAYRGVHTLTEELHTCNIPTVTSVRRGKAIRLRASMTEAWTRLVMTDGGVGLEQEKAGGEGSRK